MGREQVSQIKKATYPNEQFKDITEYVNFAREHRTFGAQAYALKKKYDKQNKIPEPNIN